ncbi:YceI family protein [Chryseobacterium sp. Ch-15]|uniref:YceI family protein n=1 Tax=Chryseobacterium muglaense TaxID=2893752 RepID=A0A9Q3UW96_9FLAO|nr:MULTISPECIES: YceI family protein [Chryseobacterium]MBD3906832.1 YceI family protein [Chryseobacterium muglaense]MBO6185519.1 YceI family protein [Chryseobacterium sp.]MCC9034484.1 YceI family protein [Chryseobacterium muglaense]MCM2556585.1 YceI family protein [Chryseobacterium muglaense]
MKKILLSFAFALVSMFTFAQTAWRVDPAHSSINFNIKHMGISFVQGRFDKFNGEVRSPGANLDNGHFNFVVLTQSINTGVEMRDKHLKSEDFFDTEKFPDMRFESGSFTKVKDNNYILKGKLTIKDVTKEISIPVSFGGIAKNQQGKEVAGLQARFTVNRLDYNIKYDPTGAGVAKDVEVSLFLELVK